VPLTTPAFHQKRSKGALNRRDQLAKAVLLFHCDSGEWTSEGHAAWREATGEDEVTVRVLCDLAQRIVYRTHSS
jgi:hypothetical protein